MGKIQTDCHSKLLGLTNNKVKRKYGIVSIGSWIIPQFQSSRTSFQNGKHMLTIEKSECLPPPRPHSPAFIDTLSFCLRDGTQESYLSIFFFFSKPDTKHTQTDTHETRQTISYGIFIEITVKFTKSGTSVKLPLHLKLHIIWTASSEFGTYRLCEQRRFRRACASAQSRQNLRCSLIQAVSQEEPSDRKPDH